MPDSRTEAIKTHVRRFLDARKKMHDLPDTVDRKVTAIREDEWLTPEQRTVKEKEIRAEAMETWRTLTAEADYAYKCAQDLIRSSRIDQKPREDARERVNRLLDGGTAPLHVLRQAVQQGDEETVIALRSAMHYWKPEGVKEFPDASETIIACDRALADLAVGEGERERSKAAAQLADARAGLETVQLFAMQGAEGSAKGKSRIAAAHAMDDRPVTGELNRGGGDDGGDA
jgi:hypothetical protein